MEQVWGRRDQEFSFENINFEIFIRYPSINHTIGPAVLEPRRKNGNINLGNHLGNNTG